MSICVCLRRWGVGDIRVIISPQNGGRNWKQIPGQNHTIGQKMERTEMDDQQKIAVNVFLNCSTVVVTNG